MCLLDGLTITLIDETPIELINVTKTDGKTIATLIQDCLIRHALQCRSQAYNGAANMSRHLHGVVVRIQEIEPRAVMVHCLAHCTNLCLQSVGRQALCIREALDFVKGINDLICCLPKRSSVFELLRAQISTSTSTLKLLCPTRWTVRTAAINSILTNYCTREIFGGG